MEREQHYIDAKIDSESKKIWKNLQGSFSKFEESLTNELLGKVRKSVNDMIGNHNVKIAKYERTIANLQSSLSELTQNYAVMSAQLHTLKQNQPVVLDRLKNDIMAEISARQLETTNSNTREMQAQMNTIMEKINQLNTNAAPRPESTPTTSTHQAAMQAQISALHNKLEQLQSRPTDAIAVTPVVTQPAKSVTTPAANTEVQVASLLADKLADLVNKEDPPLFDGSESFSHFLSTFEDYLSDWKIPQEKWKIMLTKSFRKGLESATGKKNHKLELFMINTTFRLLSFEGLKAAAKKHFEEDPTTTYYDKLLHAAQNPTESLQSWYNRVHGMYKDTLKFETTRDSESERSRVQTLACEVFASKIHDTCLRALLSSSDTKNKTLEALYRQAERSLRALAANRASDNKPLVTAAQSQIVTDTPLPHSTCGIIASHQSDAPATTQPETPCQVARVSQPQAQPTRATPQSAVAAVPDNAELLNNIQAMLSSFSALLKKPEEAAQPVQPSATQTTQAVAHTPYPPEARTYRDPNYYENRRTSYYDRYPSSYYHDYDYDRYYRNYNRNHSGNRNRNRNSNNNNHHRNNRGGNHQNHNGHSLNA